MSANGSAVRVESVERVIAAPGVIGTGRACFRQWPLFLGLLLPVVVFLSGSLFPSFYDTVIIRLIHELFLSWLCWPILGAVALIVFFRQVQSSVLLWIPLLLLGVVCGVMLVFDGWYYRPYAAAVAIALALWRILWAGWAHRWMVTLGLAAVMMLAVVAVGMDNWQFDDRITAGIPIALFRVVYLVVGVAALAFFVSFWVRNIILVLETRTRDLLACLITRNLRCRIWFDTIKSITRCSDAAATKPLTFPTALECCARKRSLSRGASRTLPKTAAPIAFWAAAFFKRIWEIPFDVLSRWGTADEKRVFPDTKEVPFVVKHAVNFAVGLLRRNVRLCGVLRLLRPEVSGLAMPSQLFRAMLWEGAQREYKRYWEDVVASMERPERMMKAELHFGRMTELYEAWIEAEFCFFLVPQQRPELSMASERISSLRRKIEKETTSGTVRSKQSGSMREPSVNLASASPANAERLNALTVVYNKYLDFWLENLDRLVMCKGLTKDKTLFEHAADLRHPVCLAQLLCNLLACRESLRQLGCPGMDSRHSLIADLSLWCLVRQTARDDLAPDGKPDPAVRETRSLFNRYFDEIATAFSNRKQADGEGVISDILPEVAMAASAYALWQAACGNWQTAFRPIFLLGQLNKPIQSIFNGVRMSCGELPVYAVLRIAEHIRFIQALQALKAQMAADEVALKAQGASGDMEMKDVEFSALRAVEVALGLTSDAPARDVSDFLSWYPDRNRIMAAFLAKQAASLIGGRV